GNQRADPGGMAPERSDPPFVELHRRTELGEEVRDLGFLGPEGIDHPSDQFLVGWRRLLGAEGGLEVPDLLRRAPRSLPGDGNLFQGAAAKKLPSALPPTFGEGE